MSVTVTTLLDAVTTVSAGTAVGSLPSNKTFQAFVTGTGALTATVLIEGSLNGVDWYTVATLSLSGTTRATAGNASNTPWALVRANVTARTGTGAAVTAYVGCEYTD